LARGGHGGNGFSILAKSQIFVLGTSGINIANVGKGTLRHSDGNGFVATQPVDPGEIKGIGINVFNPLEIVVHRLLLGYQQGRWQLQKRTVRFVDEMVDLLQFWLQLSE